MAKGTIQVHTENIFPIIKKWLYSDKDIFIRELVSNGCDAIAKLKKLVGVGEVQVEDNPQYAVTVTVDKENKTLTFSDNGIGMTAEEVEKYITQVAFSGAEEFLSKYKDDNTIIGHFGLGFYSAFMVADKVEIHTLSCQPDAKPAFWSCDGGTDYELTEGTRTERGSDVILHISADNEDMLNFYTVESILHKYCSFLPTNIYCIDANASKEENAAENETTDETPKEPTPINDPNPLWLKQPSECTDEEYIDFYHKVFFDFTPPLFWIHLNVDYPFNLKGILYFPKLKHEMDSSTGQIKLYNNQVFVADNIKEVIPEYLMLLKGVIDCPDLPLNVSRSFLQNDGYVRKVSEHITKKVADKLTSMFKTDRPSYEKYWDDISPFIKFGCMKDEKFFDRIGSSILYKTTDETYVTLEEYLDKAKEQHENKVYYVSDPKQQAQYVSMFQENGLQAVILPHVLDTHFISFAEYKNNTVKFERIDAGLADSLKNDSVEQSEELIQLFKDTLKDDQLKIELTSLKNESVPAIVTLDEQSRRMEEMSKMFGGPMMAGGPVQKTLTLNMANPAVRALAGCEDKELADLTCHYIYDIATLAQTPLSAEQMTEFVSRTGQILNKLFQ